MGDNISDLPGAIRRAWEALVPAIFQSISAVVCVAYVLDWREVVAAIRPVARSLLNPPSAMAQETIKLYGLSAVIPFALVVTSIALTQAVSRVVSWLGERAPGHLRQNSTVTFFEVLREQDFHRMLQYFPNIRDLSNIRDLMDLNMIDAIIERDIRAAQNSPTAPVQFGWALWAKQQVSRVTSLADFVKGLLVIAWASWLLGPWFLQAPQRWIWRLAVVNLLLLALLTFLAQRCIALSKTYARAKISGYLSFRDATAETPSRLDLSSQQQNLDTYRALDQLRSDSHWVEWEFVLFPKRSEGGFSALRQALWK